MRLQSRDLGSAVVLSLTITELPPFAVSQVRTTGEIRGTDFSSALAPGVTRRAELAVRNRPKSDRLEGNGSFSGNRFRAPFDAAGKKWVRFAVWDSAGNGAFIQPVHFHLKWIRCPPGFSSIRRHRVRLIPVGDGATGWLEDPLPSCLAFGSG